MITWPKEMTPALIFDNLQTLSTVKHFNNTDVVQGSQNTLRWASVDINLEVFMTRHFREGRRVRDAQSVVRGVLGKGEESGIFVHSHINRAIKDLKKCQIIIIQ